VAARRHQGRSLLSAAEFRVAIADESPGSLGRRQHSLVPVRLLRRWR
jgi:hypothetical protein